MAHFALIKETIVIAVIVVDNNAITDNGVEVEQLGIDLIESLNIKGLYDYDTVRQTSYNSNFRNKYAGIGDTWNEINNVFILPKPFLSWILDANFKWKSQVSYPSSGNYTWNETLSEWIEFTFN
jgi:hypothetical protein